MSNQPMQILDAVDAILGESNIIHLASIRNVQNPQERAEFYAERCRKLNGLNSQLHKLHNDLRKAPVRDMLLIELVQNMLDIGCDAQDHAFKQFEHARDAH